MASIVVAIVLGFAVSTWDQGRRDRARGQDALERILLEMQRNVTEVTEAAPYHLRIATAMDSLMRADGDGPFDPSRVADWRGIRPPTLRTASYQIAVSTGALEHVDFRTVDRIASEYELLGDLSNVVENGMAAFLNGTMTELSDFLRLMSLLAEQSAGVAFSLERALDELDGLDATVSSVPPALPCDAGVADFLKVYRTALDERDAAVLPTLYVDDERFEWLENGEVRYRSAEEVIASLASFPPEMRVESAYADTSVQCVGEDGAAVSMSFETTIGEGESAFAFTGAISMTLERSDEVWRIVNGHTSTHGDDDR